MGQFVIVDRVEILLKKLENFFSGWDFGEKR